MDSRPSPKKDLGVEGGGGRGRESKRKSHLVISMLESG
jgi:hypothetical protein